MSILIKGMEMPTEGTVITTIYKLNGKFYVSVHGTELCPIVPVQPHGRLIDADELLRAALENFFFHFVPRWMVKEAPTVIPADKDGRYGIYDLHDGFIPDDDAPEEKIITNADSIRSMTDEELADEILRWFNWLNAVDWQSDRIINWLKEEVKDGI